MSYTKQTWVDGPLTDHPAATPMSAGRFNHMEDGIGLAIPKPVPAPNDGDVLLWDAVSGATRAVSAPTVVNNGAPQYQYRARYSESGVFPVTMTDPRTVCQKSVDGGTLLSYPSLAKDGATLLCTYADGGTVTAGAVAGGSGSTTRLKKSLDNGATWQTGALIWDESLSTRAAVAVLANGSYLVSSQTYSGATSTGVKGKISTNQGATWGATFAIVPTTAYTTGDTFVGSIPFQLANGTILQAVYGTDGGHTGTITKVYASTNNGTTWAYRATVLSLAGGVSALSAAFQQLASGTIVALVRCSDYTVRRTVSADSGTTWSAPTTLFTDCDSRISWVRLSSGRSVACYRNQVLPDPYLDMATPTRAYVRYSDDDFVTYSAAERLHGCSKAESFHSVLEVAPNSCLVAYGELEAEGNHGNIFGRYLLDGHGLAPTGQNTYIPASTRARGGNRVLAYDTFTRPATYTLLGTSDSGHQWVQTSVYGASPSPWAIAAEPINGESCAMPNLGVYSMVINAGVENGSIEADLKWNLAGGSLGLGLVGRQSLTTGRSIYTNLLGGGGPAQTSTLIYGYTATAEATAVNQTSYVAHTSATLSYLPGIWYRAKLVIKGILVRYYIDGVLVNSYNMTSGSTEYNNSVGSNTWWGIRGGRPAGAGQGLYFRNVVVNSI